MQCRELFQEMAIDIIPPYMIAAKVGPLGYPSTTNLRTVDTQTHQISEQRAAGPPEDPGSSSLIHN